MAVFLVTFTRRSKYADECTSDVLAVFQEQRNAEEFLAEFVRVKYPRIEERRAMSVDPVVEPPSSLTSEILYYKVITAAGVKIWHDDNGHVEITVSKQVIR